MRTTVVADLPLGFLGRPIQDQMCRRLGSAGHEVTHIDIPLNYNPREIDVSDIVADVPTDVLVLLTTNTSPNHRDQFYEQLASCGLPIVVADVNMGPLRRDALEIRQGDEYVDLHTRRGEPYAVPEAVARVAGR